MDQSPLALFITWTVYGTHLQGDGRGWWRLNHGHEIPQPRLERWHRDRLGHDVLLLDDAAKTIIGDAIDDHCVHRDWKLWGQSVRSNHVHVVVSTHGHESKRVRDQLKANATGRLRRRQPIWIDRPVWTAKGWVEFIDSECDLETVLRYTLEAQDRKSRAD